jgi:hypothetical protein
MVLKKFFRKKIWNKFQMMKDELGRNFKSRAMSIVENAKLRNERVMLMLKETADKIQLMVTDKIALIRKRREQYDSMQNMISSIDDVTQMRIVNDDKEETDGKWFAKEAEEKEKIVKQFEQDNIWYIDKRS